MTALAAVLAFVIFLICLVVYWLRDGGKYAPKWLLDEHPHDKYDEPK